MIIDLLVMGPAIAASLVAGLSYYKNHSKIEKPENVESPFTQEDSLVLALLREGRDWSYDSYYAKHPTGIRIWIANEDYGLNYSIDGKAVYVPLDKLKGRKTVNKAIWNAFKQLDHNTRRNAQLKSTAEFAQKVVDYYNTRSTDSVLAVPRLGGTVQSERSRHFTLLDAGTELLSTKRTYYKPPELRSPIGAKTRPFHTKGTK